MKSINLEYIQGEEEILDVVQAFSPFFHNQILNNECTIRSLCKKYANNGRVLIAKDNGIIGCCAYYANDVVKQQAFLSTIVVSPSARGCGVGTELLNHMIEDCRISGMKSICLNVMNTNQKALEFYRNNGFIRIDESTDNTSVLIKYI